MSPDTPPSFPTAFRGYDAPAVDEHLRVLAEQRAKLEAQLGAATAEVHALTDRLDAALARIDELERAAASGGPATFEDLGQEVGDLVRRIGSVADESRHRREARSAEILVDAERRAAAIVADATVRAEELVQSAEALEAEAHRGQELVQQQLDEVPAIVAARAEAETARILAAAHAEAQDCIAAAQAEARARITDAQAAADAIRAATNGPVSIIPTPPEGNGATDDVIDLRETVAEGEPPGPGAVHLPSPRTA